MVKRSSLTARALQRNLGGKEEAEPKAAQPTQPVSSPKIVELVRTKPRLKVSATQVARAKAPVASAGPVAPFNPFAVNPALHPPGVVPQGARSLAMDTALFDGYANWAMAAFSGAFAEGVTFMGYAELALMAQRPEYRRMVETIARHMTRKWIKIKSVANDDAKGDRIKELEDEFARLNVRGMFQRCAEQDGFFGRAHLYIDLGTTDDRDELKTPIGDGLGRISKEKIAKGSLKRLQTVEAQWCYPTNYDSNNPLKPGWYRPRSWFALGTELDASRLLTFVGREVPDLLKPAYSFGGLALTQMAKPYVDNWLRTRQSVADIISAFSVMVLKTNLVEQLGAGNDFGESDNLVNRIDMFNGLRDNRGVMAIDKDAEDFANVSAPLGTLDVLQAQTQEHMAAVSGIPLVELLGIQPAGLNATSDGEIKVFDDWIHANQELQFRPNLTRVFRIVQLSLWGEVDPDLIFEFEPLRTLDPKEAADRQKTLADRDIAYLQEGALDPLEVRERLANDPDSGYNGIDVEGGLPRPPDPALDPQAEKSDPESDEPE